MRHFKFNFEAVSNHALIDRLVGWAADYYGVLSWDITVTQIYIDTIRQHYYFTLTYVEDDPAIAGCLELFVTGLFPNNRKYGRADTENWHVENNTWVGIKTVSSFLSGGYGSK